MDDHEDCFPQLGQFPGEPENFFIIHHVEARRRLVEEQNRRPLRQYLRQKDALFLPARYLVQRSIGQVIRAGVAHAVQGDFPVPIRLPFPPFQVGIPPGQDHFQSRIRETDFHVLVQIRHLAGQFLFRISGQDTSSI